MPALIEDNSAIEVLSANTKITIGAWMNRVVLSALVVFGKLTTTELTH